MLPRNKTGKIIKGIAGFYYVDVAGSGVYECKAKGIFRKEKMKPVVGDVADIEVLDETDMEASITAIHERRNELYRPSVANVDQVILIFALAQPDLNNNVLDHFLLQMDVQNIPAIICFNKCDLADRETGDRWKRIYESAGYDVTVCSVRSGENIDTVKEKLKGRITVLAGPSGAGKSSFVNKVAQEALMETGGISFKLKKGRHTTRHSELIIVEDGTYICDTPGFTSFRSEEMPKEELKYSFPEFRKYEGCCRFSGCNHINEPECAVRDAVKNGTVSEERYGSYSRLFAELAEYEKNKY